MTQSDPSLPSKTAPGLWRRWRWLVTGPLVLVAVLAALTLSLAPAVPEPQVPDAPDATAARDVIKQITGDDTARGKLVQITITQRELDGLAALASQALDPLRMQARLSPIEPVAATAVKPEKPQREARAGQLAVTMSRPLGSWAWINAAAIVRPASQTAAGGLPDIDLTLGRLPVPQWLTHWVLARQWVQLQGDVATPVALDQALRRLTMTPAQVQLALVNPGRGAALASLAQAGGATPDRNALAATFCAIADTGKTDLAVLVRRAGALKLPAGTSPQDHNRVLLAAIAMRAVPEYREKLAGAALPLVRRCAASDAPLTLAGREDLAKHWALSAAIAATVGSQVARSMGTWKELADSSQGGSGFSFVDLAADRSGERFAIAAVKPQLARAVHSRLVAITEDQMLPREALARPEGLDQAAFERGYTAVNSPEYARALRAIDRLLGNAGVP